MPRPPDRFGLRRSGITTARGRVRTWTDNRAFMQAKQESAAERNRVGTSRGGSDRRTLEWTHTGPATTLSEVPLWLVAPDSVRSEGRRPHDNQLVGLQITNLSGKHHWVMSPPGPRHIFNPWSDDPWIGNPRREDPLGELAANALLYPGWRYRGLTEVAQRLLTSALGRTATEIDLVRTLPWSDPRTLGTDDWPWDVEDAVLIQVVEDRETGAVVEWRTLFRDKVYARHWWDRLDLDVDLDPALFDVDIEPELAPWEGPFTSTVVEPPPANPPVVTIEDGRDGAVRQQGLLVGRVWAEGDERVKDHARPGHPTPAGVGPFGRDVILRLETSTMPTMARLFLFDAGRHFIPIGQTVLGDRVSSIDPVGGRFDRGTDGAITAALTLPEWSGRLHLRVDVTWFSPALAHASTSFGPVGAEYAFTLET